ncbi:MAG: hypothetical protein AABZ11_09230, partial [Nitrospinota bacterium]
MRNYDKTKGQTDRFNHTEELSRFSLEENEQLRQEITKYKQSEEMLKLHEIRLQSLLNLNMMLNASEKEILDFILEECLKV